MTATAPVTVTGVDFVVLMTEDLDAARAFYGDVLGLECSALWRESDPVGAEFETGNLTLALVDAARIGMTFAPSVGPVALHVEDVAAARAALEARGVAFRADTMDSGVCHMAHFRDPDGNVLMLHSRYAPRTPRAAA
jgi:predicted enzyme related to lactoylglutathione lyase